MGPSLRIFISIFPSVPCSSLPFCCSEPASRGWTESGVHHCTSPPWGNTIFLCVPRWVSAWRWQNWWDLISYWCMYWVCMALDLIEGWVHTTVFATVRILAESLASTQLPLFLEAVWIYYLCVLWMFAELGQNWTVGSEAIWEEFTVTLVHTQCDQVRFLFLGKQAGKALGVVFC